MEADQVAPARLRVETRGVNGFDASERGDTMVEVLVALIIISISAVALLGGLLTTTSTSVTHRGIVNLDSMLRSVAESARYQIETQASFGPGSGPQFQQCATTSSYTVVSSPFPASGPASSTTATVFTLGITPSTVSVGGLAATITSTSGGPSGAAVSFAIPSLATGNYPVSVNGINAASEFQVTDSTSQPDTVPLSGYTLDSTMKYWASGSFGSTCTTNTRDSDIQQINLSLSENDPGNAATDNIDVSLSDFNPLAVSAVSQTCVSGCIGSTGSLGQTFRILVAVPGNAGLPTPTGTATCPGGSTQSLVAGTTTCTVSNPTPGTYSATYSGDTYYAGGNAQPAVTVPKYTPTMSQPSLTPSPPAAGQTITFTSTFNGVSSFPPSGQVTWNGPCSSTTALTLVGTSYQSSCTETNASGGTYTETATYVAGSDPDYKDSAPSPPLNYTVLYPGTPTMTVSTSPDPASPPATVTFTATISQPSGAPVPTGTVTWSGITPGVKCLSPAPLPSKPPYTVSCTVVIATAGSYTATAAYSGDGNYAGGSASQSVSVLYPGTPTMAVSPSKPAAGSNVVFSATITEPAGAPPPTGTITWSGIPAGTSTCASPASLPTTAAPTGSYTVTCEVDNVSKGTLTATATYSGDPNYFGGSASITVRVS